MPPAETVRMAREPLPVTDGQPAIDVFVPLGPITPRELSRSSLQLMRVRLRGDKLSRLGVAVDDVWASEVVEADVLFGEDGIARAIRFER